MHGFSFTALLSRCTFALMVGVVCTRSATGAVDDAELAKFWTPDALHVPYRAIVTDGRRDHELLPLIVFLHGDWQDGTDNESQLAGYGNGSLELVDAARDGHVPLVYIAPQTTDAYWPPDRVMAVVRDAIAGIQGLLAGQALDLREVPLDMSGVSAFHQQVYAIARAIPPGQTRTYGEVAEQLGGKGLSRAVGQALGLNPFAPVVPCHRVLAAGDKPGGFSAGGGALTKMRMLQIEGACQGGTRSLFGSAD